MILCEIEPYGTSCIYIYGTSCRDSEVMAWPFCQPAITKQHCVADPRQFSPGDHLLRCSHPSLLIRRRAPLRTSWLAYNTSKSHVSPANRVAASRRRRHPRGAARTPQAAGHHRAKLGSLTRRSVGPPSFRGCITPPCAGESTRINSKEDVPFRPRPRAHRRRGPARRGSF